MEQNTPFEVKDMTGTLWMEIQEKDGPNGPYKVRSGSIKVNNVEYWLNAYEKETKTGKILLSLTIKPKTPKTGEQSTSEVAPF